MATAIAAIEHGEVTARPGAGVSVGEDQLDGELAFGEKGSRWPGWSGSRGS